MASTSSRPGAPPEVSDEPPIARVLLAFAAIFDVQISWMGKHVLFKPPLGWLMRRLGGIPVVRHRCTRLVDQVIVGDMLRPQFNHLPRIIQYIQIFSFHGWSGVRVSGRRTMNGIQKCCTVPNGPTHHMACRHATPTFANVRASRIAPTGWLQTHLTAAGCGDTYRATTIRRMSNWYPAIGNGRSSPSTGPAGGVIRVPGISSRTIQGWLGRHIQAELWCIRASKDHQARLPVARVLGRDALVNHTSVESPQLLEFLREQTPEGGVLAQAGGNHRLDLAQRDVPLALL